MYDKGELLSYLKMSIKELLEECNDIELLYLVKGLLLKEDNEPVSY